MGMSIVVKKVTQFVIGFIYLYGVYITAFGHMTPGGGFPGGVILACGLILVLLSFGKEIILGKISSHIAHLLDSGAGLAFLFIGLFGLFFGTFFINFLSKGTPFHLKSAGFIPLLNFVIGIKVSSSIFLAVLALALFGRWVDSFGIEEKGDVD